MPKKIQNGISESKVAMPNNKLFLDGTDQPRRSLNITLNQRKSQLGMEEIKPKKSMNAIYLYPSAFIGKLKPLENHRTSIVVPPKTPVSQTLVAY